MNKRILYIFLLLIIASSCSVKKYLPDGEKLYRGATVNIKKDKEVKTSIGTLKKQLKAAARPAANKFILGQPYKVWWWYVIGEQKRPTGLKAWFRKKLGEPPVLSSSVTPKSNAENMQAWLENNGYFHSIVKGDTVNKSYFTNAIYTANVSPQYKIKSITWVSDSSALLKELESSKSNSVLKVGSPYSLSDIDAERSRLDLRLKTKGYYFFNPDYIMAYADSTIGNRQVDLFLNVKKSTPANAKHPYTINQIMIFPNYTLLLPPPDTSKFGMLSFDTLLIRDTVHKFKPELFKSMITYRPGKKYSSKDQNTTLNRLINLGTFKFVKNRFAVTKDTNKYLLNAYYYLTPTKNKSLQAEIDGFSKENSYVGSKVSVNWKNRNTFKGAEQLQIKAYGSFEVSFADSLKNTNNFRVGTTASLTFPRFVLPFFSIRENSMYPPRTQFSTGYELFIKQNFYTKNIFQLQYEFDWKESINKEHRFSPIAITYLNASNISDSFYSAAKINPALLLNVYSEIILGSFYSYTLTTINPRAKNQLYFKTGIDIAGNIAGLITGAKSVREKAIFNAPFSQYLKFDGQVIYKKKVTDKTDWVNQFQVGIGLPYNNSIMLPFSKQYVIGGSSSMRGFPIRTIGPGSYLPNRNDISILQTIGGDFKLLLNSELRFPLLGNLTGALFVDAGNVWTRDTIIFGKAGQFKKDFIKEVAVSSGIGIRLDISVLLIRFDLGIPFRKPYLPDGQRWVINQIAFGDREWRRNNLILNIAIGYPF